MKKVVFLLFFISHCIVAQNNPDTVTARKIDKYAGFFKNPLQGKEMINFKGEVINEGPFELRKYKGSIIVLNFWFIGCPPCLGEVDDFNKIFNKYKDSNVKVISITNNSKEQVEKFIDGKYSKPIEQIQYPIIADASEVISSYSVTSYPTTVLIDKNGIIRLVNSGASISSLLKYVQFYGEKGLSKEWKDILKSNSNKPQTEMSDFFIDLIDELLKE